MNLRSGAQRAPLNDIQNKTHINNMFLAFLCKNTNKYRQNTQIEYIIE